MRNFILSFLLIYMGCAAWAVYSQELASKLKEDYFKEMVASDSLSPEVLLIWYDSLLNVTKHNTFDIVLNKIKLLNEAGYPENAYSLAEELLHQHPTLPLNHKLPLLYHRATSMYDSKNLIGAISEFNNLLEMHKPDSLKYWDLQTAMAMICLYSDVKDVTMAEHWLKKFETMVSTYPLTDDYRRDAEGRAHGSRAMLLIEGNRLDSAYKEVKFARELGSSPHTLMASLIQTAQIYIEKGQTEAARQYLEQALNIKANDHNRRTAIFLLACTFMEEGRYDEALRVLLSQVNMKANSMPNLRAYYIVKGQAYAGMGNYEMAFNSLDSALVVGDSIMAKMTLFQCINADKYIQSQKVAEDSSKSTKKLIRWIIMLCVLFLILMSAMLPMLLKNLRLRKRILQQRLQVKQAQIDTHYSHIIQTRSLETEDNLNRRQTALLLRLAHLDTALDALKKKLAADNLDMKDRDEILHQLQNISGKEKMWELFSMQFEMTNRRFLDLLSERHPTLTKSEKRICAFMLINLSTKEIAELLQRSPRTVDVTKYNIRKKLSIDEISTDEYLRQLAEEANTSRLNPVNTEYK